MTLAELATYAAKIVRMPDDVTVAQAKEFLRLRWRMIWDATVWTQTVITHSQAVPAATQELTIDEPLVDRVLAIRWNSETDLPGVSWDTAYRGDPASWDAPGSPLSYIERPKAADGSAVIRFQRCPTQAGAVLILAKRACPQLALDTDTPTLSGADQALVAYAVGDLLDHMGQTGRAQARWQEGVAHQQKMIEIDTQQPQAVRRLIPTSDYSDGIAGGWLSK